MARALRRTDQTDFFATLPAPALEQPSQGAYGMRDYQEAANEAIDRALEVHKSTLLVMCTGGGKTVVFAEQARRRGGILVLAHRDTLIQQAAQKLRHHTKEDVAIEKADRRAYATPFVVASVQSLRGDRLRKFAASHRPALLVIDECHRAASKSYLDIVAAFPDTPLLGVTATPDRGDGVGMWNVFEKANTDHGAAYCYDMRQAIDDAWLTNFDYRPVFAPIALDKIKAKSTGNLDEKTLDIEVSRQAGEIARSLIDSCQGITLGFTTGVQSAEVTAEALNRLRPDCARSVHGGMDDLEKQRIVDRWLAGDFEYLINCAVYIEGADFPELLNVFDAALTKSRSRHAQKVGRGTRLWPHGIDHLATKEERHAAIAKSPKPRWNYYHLNGLGDRHDLATPVDLLGGLATPDEQRLAKSILREAGGSVDGALAEAKARLEEERARLAAQAAREAAKRKAQIGDHRDPFALLHMKPQAEWETGLYEPASEAQKRRCRELGVREPTNDPTFWEKLSKQRASKLIGTCIKRNSLGLATLDQIRQLQDFGIMNGHTLRASKARDILSQRHDQNRAKKLPWFTGWGGQTVNIPDREPGDGA